MGEGKYLHFNSSLDLSSPTMPPQFKGNHLSPNRSSPNQKEERRIIRNSPNQKEERRINRNSPNQKEERRTNLAVLQCKPPVGLTQHDNLTTPNNTNPYSEIKSKLNSPNSPNQKEERQTDLSLIHRSSQQSQHDNLTTLNNTNPYTPSLATRNETSKPPMRRSNATSHLRPFTAPWLTQVARMTPVCTPADFALDDPAIPSVPSTSDGSNNLIFHQHGTNNFNSPLINTTKESNVYSQRSVESPCTSFGESTSKIPTYKISNNIGLNSAEITASDCVPPTNISPVSLKNFNHQPISVVYGDSFPQTTTRVVKISPPPPTVQYKIIPRYVDRPATPMSTVPLRHGSGNDLNTISTSMSKPISSTIHLRQLPSHSYRETSSYIRSSAVQENLSSPIHFASSHHEKHPRNVQITSPALHTESEQFSQQCRTTGSHSLEPFQKQCLASSPGHLNQLPREIRPPIGSPLHLSRESRPPTGSPLLQEVVTESVHGVSGSSKEPYQPHFQKGALISMGSCVKVIEELQTKDFLNAVRLDPASFALDPATVVDLRSNGSLWTITFRFHSHNKEVCVDISRCHPFFVFNEGWSSCEPQATNSKYNLDVRQLSIGDVCITLRKIDSSNTPLGPLPQSVKDAKQSSYVQYNTSTYNQEMPPPLTTPRTPKSFSNSPSEMLSSDSLRQQNVQVNGYDGSRSCSSKVGMETAKLGGKFSVNQCQTNVTQNILEKANDGKNIAGFDARTFNGSQNSIKRFNGYGNLISANTKTCTLSSSSPSYNTFNSLPVTNTLSDVASSNKESSSGLVISTHERWNDKNIVNTSSIDHSISTSVSSTSPIGQYSKYHSQHSSAQPRPPVNIENTNISDTQPYTDNKSSKTSPIPNSPRKKNSKKNKAERKNDENEEDDSLDLDSSANRKRRWSDP